MGVFLKVLGEEARSFVPWVLWLTVSLAVAVSGPFGSYSAMSLGERVVFWAPVIAGAVALATVIRAFVHGVLGLRGTLRGTLLGAGFNCVAMCPPLFLLIKFVLPPMFLGASYIGEIALLVASMSLGICALRDSGDAKPPPVQDVDLRVVHKRDPRLMRRIDAPLQGEIWAITVRDHYVDVQTSRGKASLLMRFTDAMDEVDCVPGAQVHRSHWVAWAGVGSVCREGGKINLHLKNGHQIPVSRNNRDKVDLQFPPMVSAKDVAA